MEPLASAKGSGRPKVASGGTEMIARYRPLGSKAEWHCTLGLYRGASRHIPSDAKLTPDQIIETMKQGNERFRAGKMSLHDYLAQKRATIAGQYPAAVILSCIDSRAPAEIILDAGIGDTFNARIAGNIATDDLLGSLEFACALAGAKVVLVMGHTACGAIKGAIDGAQLGNLTGLLNKIKPAVNATHYEGERTSKNGEFVDEVAKTNVRLTIGAIRQRSDVLAGLEKDGKIKIVGSMYRLAGGHVDFFT
jgi:carbonic anhydrase